jgi:cold shock protein
VSSRDRDFRPTRRRGFDEDNFESPRHSFGSPSSAQRFEAPSGPPVQAVVKWYNPDKGFGFVQLADGSGDAFLHVSVVERSGHDSVPPGATLGVRAGPGPKGPQVTEILSVDSSTAQQELPRRARSERPVYAPAEQAAVEESGTGTGRCSSVSVAASGATRQTFGCAASSRATARRSSISLTREARSPGGQGRLV